MKKYFLSTCLLLAALGAMADDVQQTVVINGETVAKTVTRITFSGDDAVLTFSDATTTTADLEAVSISFAYTPTKISAAAAQPVDGKVYNLNGQQVANSTADLPKGVYVVSGKKVIIK